MYEQTCRKHHQTPTRFSSANSLPDKQFHARVFALHQSERALEVNVSRFCRGKSIFKYYTRAPVPSLHNAPPTHAGPVHSAIPGSGHNHTHRRTSSATAKRLYVLGAARTRHLPALEFPERNAHSGPFIPGDCRPRSQRRARASEDRVPCDRRRSTQQLAKPQDEASERRPRARVHQRYAVFHAPSSGNAFKPYSFLPDTVPSRNTALRSRANAFAPTKRSRRIDDHPIASTDLVSHPFASDTASVSTGKNTVDSSVHATAFDAPFDDAPAPVAPATPVNTPAAPRETKVYDDVDCIIEVRFRPRYPPFAPRGVRSDPNFGPVRFKNVD